MEEETPCFTRAPGRPYVVRNRDKHSGSAGGSAAEIADLRIRARKWGYRNPLASCHGGDLRLYEIAVHGGCDKRWSRRGHPCPRPWPLVRPSRQCGSQVLKRIQEPRRRAGVQPSRFEAEVLQDVQSGRDSAASIRRKVRSRPSNASVASIGGDTVPPLTLTRMGCTILPSPTPCSPASACNAS
jgi:hypothetical protein